MGRTNRTQAASYGSLRQCSVVLCAIVGGAGCTEEVRALDIAGECHPLGGVACLAPWPSAAYLIEAETTTGFRVDLPAAAMPRNVHDVAIDPEPYNRFDGFSPSGPMLALFPTGVSPEGLPGHDDPAASLAVGSPTVVLDMATGERVAHFAEVDQNVPYPDERALIIRPLVRLAPATRYAVAIRASVKAADGTALPVPPGFQAVLDRANVDHPRMAALASRYDAIFAALDSHGIGRDELVLAWDFVTASDESLTSDLLAMRERAEPYVPGGGDVTAEEISADPALVHRALAGTYEAPNFLSSGEAVDSVLVRDADGKPTRSGTYRANYAAVLPACVSQPDAVLPIPVVVFGHGLFGSAAGYVEDTFLQQVANQLCAAVVAGDFIGLTSRQFETVSLVAIDLDRAATVTEKLAQSIINFIALEHAVRDGFAGDPRFQYEGQPILDGDRMFYIGGSLGGIMGAVFMAYDTTIERGVLGVPGGAWSLLFERSFAWRLLRAAALASYRDPLDYSVLVALLAMRFEPYDPITTAHRVIADPLPDTPAKDLLLYQAMGDSLVSNLSTEMLARTMGLGVVAPSVRVPHGLEATTEPRASALTIYDEHPSPLPPAENLPPEEDNGTHSGINQRGAVIRQVAEFLLRGAIVNPCLLAGKPAPCDCATGVCD